MAKVVRLSYGREFANTYVVGEENEPALVFDLGSNPNHALERYLERHHGGKLLGIFITHGHYDHIGGLENLNPPEAGKIFFPSGDIDFLGDPSLNFSESLIGEAKSLENVTFYALEDEDEIKLGNYVIKVIGTPYRTRGSVCFYLEKEGLLFSGDSLFCRGIGRYDLKGAAPRLREASLRKLKRLPHETKVYPGHGPSTTIGEELLYNEDLLHA